MTEQPEIYILAGANGVGKTTLNIFTIPKEVTFINADDIAKQLKERLGDINVQEVANAQALEHMNALISKRQSFAIETNLADQETWHFIKGVQNIGYSIRLYFFGVSEVDVCINRVHNRVLQGGHFVHPDIVRLRYEVGLKLLKQHKAIPDQLILTDNAGESLNCAELNLGKVVWKLDTLPDWVQFVLADEFENSSDYHSITSVRQKYLKMKGKK
jgi:predicted ABC-type ATPase